MANDTPTSGNKIVIQDLSKETITISVNGEIREIRNQLEELKVLLGEMGSQKVQYAEKIYNIEHINEANFGFMTGKKAFNEVLTRQLIETIKPTCRPAQRFLEIVGQKKIVDWERNKSISDKAKEIIAYSFVGVIGIQLSKLVAIGKEDFSEAKQRKYIEKCLHIAKRSLDLVIFALLSELWDAQKKQFRELSEAHQDAIAQRFDTAFEPSLKEQFQLLLVLFDLFSTVKPALKFPFKELGAEEFAQQMQEGSALRVCIQKLQELNEKLDKARYDLLDCFEAENQPVEFFKPFYFLVNYRMASIKHIGYRQIRYNDPHYLHRYAALGIDNKANVNAEKINYTPRAVHTDAVLLYQGDAYDNYINLFPFVIDYNALTFEQGAKICFYRSQDITDGFLEYLFLADNSTEHIEKKGILKPDTDFNELMKSTERRKLLNLDSVVEQFHEARRCILGDVLDFEDL